MELSDLYSQKILDLAGNAPQPGRLADADGSAILVHGGADDFTSQPSGDSGPRIGCGVIFPGTGATPVAVNAGS